MALIMGIDIGTSSLKVVVMDSAGCIKAQGGKGYSIDIPITGYAEQDPRIWWRACIDAVCSCFANSEVKSTDISAISFSGQMHGTVVLDKDNNVIRPAILHCDQRSMKQVNEIKAILGEKYISEVLLNPIFPGFQLVTLVWMKENEPDNFARIEKVMSPKDYIKYLFTGVISTDYSDASATLAYDIRKGCWNSNLLTKLSLPHYIFPDCLQGTGIVGVITKFAADETGLAIDTTVVNGGSDQVMQSIGNGVIEPGEATVTIGTSGQVFFPTSHPTLNPDVNTHTFCGLEKNSWYTMGAMLSAGICLRWYKDLIGISNETSYKYFDELVATVPPGSDGLIFLPYMSGERTPHLNANAKGMFVGLTHGKTKETLANAIMEGVGFALNECLQTCMGLGLVPKKLIASGGAARSSKWLQIQADIYNCPLYFNNVSEHAAVGAAITAGVGVGIYKNIREGCELAIQINQNPIIPNASNVSVYKEYYELFKEIYIANRSIFDKVSSIDIKRGLTN